MRKRIILMAAFGLMAMTAQTQDLKNDSIKVQMIIKEAGKGKTAPYLATITDKDKVAFLTGYIAAKAEAKEQRLKDDMEAFDNTLGARYLKGDKSAIPKVVAILKKADPEKVNELFDQMQDYGKPFVTDPAVKQELVKLLENKEMEARTVNFIGYREPEGWVQILEDRLLTGKSVAEEGLYTMLADVASEKAFDYYTKKHGGQPYEFIKNLPWSFQREEYFGKASDRIRTAIVNNAYRLLTELPISEKDLEDEAEEDAESTPLSVKYRALSIILKHGDERTIPVYTNYIELVYKLNNNENNSEIKPDMDSQLLRFYTGQKKKETLFRMLKRNDAFFEVCEAVYNDPALAADAEMNAAIFAKYEKPKLANYDPERFVSYFHTLDKAAFDKLVDAYIKAPFKREMLKKQYAFSYQTLADTNKYLYDNGLVASPITETMLYGQPAEESVYKGYNPIFTSLELAGITYGYGIESDAVPADYDHLLDELAAISKGKIGDYKRYLQYRMEEDEEDYHVYDFYLFVSHKDKVYILAPNTEYPYSYDTEAVQSLLGVMATAAGGTGRYTLMGFDGDYGNYIFGDPAIVEKLMKDYDLHGESADEQ